MNHDKSFDWDDEYEWSRPSYTTEARHVRPPMARYIPTWTHETSVPIHRSRHVERDPQPAINIYPQARNRDYERDYSQHVERIAERNITRELDVVREYKIERARERLAYEIARYDTEVKQYLHEFTNDEDTMKRTAKTLYDMDEEPRVLVEKTASFLEVMEKVSVPDDPDDDDTLVDTEDDEPLPLTKTLSEPKFVPPTKPVANKFMHWSSFEPHPLNSNTDIVDDRRRTYVALANEIGVGAGVPFGEVTLEGFCGILVRLLRRQDWRAYFKASGARNIWLPQSKRPSALELEQLEDNLFGTSQYTGAASSMTCLTYSKFDYGTITLFNVSMSEDNLGKSWPQSIEPVAAMTYVPKRLLKKIGRSVPKANKTKLEVNSRAEKESRRFKWTAGQSQPYYARSRRIGRSGLPGEIAEALALEMSWLERIDKKGPMANFICARIPQMIAWLHVKASLLTEINIEGTEFRQDNKIEGVVRWHRGPTQKSHNGQDPCIVVLHPRDVNWVNKPLYWTGVKDT